MVGTDLALGLADLADLADLALEGMGHTDLALALAGRRLEVVLVDHMGLVLGLEDLVLVAPVPAGRTVTWA